MSLVDSRLDRVTMYRLVFWYLVALIVATAILGAFKLSPIDPVALMESTVLVLAAGWLTNRLFAHVFGAIPNGESVYITGMIIVLIMEPAPLTDLAAVGANVVACCWAMASKFIVSVRGRHVFNPAALGVALVGLALDRPATWWVSGEPWLIPLVVTGGLLIVRKLRRVDLVLAFVATNLTAALWWRAPGDALSSVQSALLNSPLMFFAFVMLTEPLTAPQAKLWRIIYGAIVGLLASPDTVIAGFYFTPEVALLAGNLFTLMVSPRGRLILTLERIEKAASGVYEYVFNPDHELAFKPGQYLEWTLPADFADSRGNRRYFTIASAPSEPQVRLGVKFSSNGSAFKLALAQLRPGDRVVASQLAGSFVLPGNPQARLAFVAGGIGITPFSSMLRELLARNEPRDIIVLYGNNRIDEVAYAGLLRWARRELGIPTYLAVRDGADLPGVRTGLINEAMIRECVPDYRSRIFYVSGPRPMVVTTSEILRNMGVPPFHIKTDFFPGFA